MERLLVLLLCFVLMCSIRGQSTTTILENIDIAPNLPSIDIASFTHDLVSNADTDKDKIWTIYKYVIDHISYDKSAYKNGIRRINRNNSDVLRRKTAVCWGYSELIREMCSYAGIKCLSISGYARDLQIPSRSFEKANHAWNAVRLNGEWFLLDATWASGISSEEDYFMSVYGVDYFLTPPALFIKNHFPLLPMWQLLSCPLSLEEFYAESDVRRESCSFKYNRHINKFLELSNLEQEAQTITIAYRMNRSQKNRKLLGHALVDIAIEKKEAGEEYFEANQEEFAIEQLEASLQLFEIASEYCKLYPWQEYAYVITSINLVQAYYFLYDEDIDRYPFILSQFLESRLLVEKSNMDIIVKEHAYKSIDRYIEILVETISLMTADSQ